MTQVFGSMSFSPFCAAFDAIKTHVQQSINTSQISKLASCLLSRLLSPLLPSGNGKHLPPVGNPIFSGTPPPPP